ncbi:MAG: glycosyltransferase family 9 protein [Ignavibacterium sp.]|jgi:ADP-heptose:LPS heptosyltransferase|nr:glycosyltransferase family 9 protein [Ignavibacterium sp.]
MTLKEKIDSSKLLNWIVVYFCDFLFSLIRIVSRRKTEITGKVLLISLHKLGDTVFTIPAIKALLREKNISITIVCFSHSEIIYKKQLDFVEYIIVDYDEFIFGGRIASKRLRKKIKNLQVDSIVDMKGSVISASMIFNHRCSLIYGINEIYYRKIYSTFIPIRNSPHQIDLYFDAAKAFNPELNTSFNGFQPKRILQDEIYIIPLAGWSAKEWGLNNFISLYKMLIEKYKVSFVFPQNAISDDIISELRYQNIKVINSEDIEHFFQLLETCKLLISNDSGPIQMAAMIGIPTFTIYGPTNPIFHMPLGKNNHFIRKELDCSPYTTKVCYADAGESCGHRSCMNQLNIYDVFNQIELLIKDIDSDK